MNQDGKASGSQESPSPDRTLKLSPSAPPRRSSDPKPVKKPALKRPAASNEQIAKKKPSRRDRDGDGSSSESDETLPEKERCAIRQSKIYNEWYEWADYNDSFHEPPPCKFEMYLAEKMLQKGWNYDGNKWTKKKQNHFVSFRDQHANNDAWVSTVCLQQRGVNWCEKSNWNIMNVCLLVVH